MPGIGDRPGEVAGCSLDQPEPSDVGGQMEAVQRDGGVGLYQPIADRDRPDVTVEGLVEPAEPVEDLGGVGVRIGQVVTVFGDRGIVIDQLLTDLQRPAVRLQRLGRPADPILQDADVVVADLPGGCGIR